jgi:hypothetical protein
MVPCTTKQGHIGTVLGATEHGTEGDHQDLVECVPRVVLARVLQFGKAGGKPLHRASGGESHGSNRFRGRAATGILAAMSNAIPLAIPPFPLNPIPMGVYAPPVQG